MLTVVTDSIAPSKLRMTTVQFKNVDAMTVLDALNDRRINHTSVFDYDDGWGILITSANWTSVLDRWEDIGSYISDLSRVARKALVESIPVKKGYNEWHMPYVSPFDVEKAVESAALHIQEQGLDQDSLLDLSFNVLVKVSAARCLAVDGTFDFDDALRSYHKWEDTRHANLMHAREHIQRPDRFTEDGMGWLNPKMHGHAEGWISFQNTTKFEEWRAAA